LPLNEQGTVDHCPQNGIYPYPLKPWPKTWEAVLGWHREADIKRLDSNNTGGKPKKNAPRHAKSTGLEKEDSNETL
jgi:hypothetical protein